MSTFCPKQIKERLPLSFLDHHKVLSSRKTAMRLISKQDPRLVLIFGPCSVHDPQSILEYGRKFKRLADQVRKECFCILRVYIEKPRTALGWKGFVYDPHLDGSNDLVAGISASRKLFLDLIQEDIPIATELLNPLLVPFFSDLITWGFIGARTVSCQPHREIASLVDFPVGFKNSLDGSFSPMINSVMAAREPQAFPLISEDGVFSLVESSGNQWCHPVLRGSFNGPNYDLVTIQQLKEKMQAHQLQQRIMIDCAHDNCEKNVEKQKQVFFEAFENYMQDQDSIIGLMMESHLKKGSQPLLEDLSHLQYGLSITDPCLSWEDTEKLVLYASKRLSSNVMRLTHN